VGPRPLRRLFASALGYRFLGVTRADLEQGTAKAIQAAASMGELPPEILCGSSRAGPVPQAPEGVGEGVTPLARPDRAVSPS
jgi:hypothetical protein